MPKTTQLVTEKTPKPGKLSPDPNYVITGELAEVAGHRSHPVPKT